MPRLPDSADRSTDDRGSNACCHSNPLVAPGDTSCTRRIDMQRITTPLTRSGIPFIAMVAPPPHLIWYSHGTLYSDGVLQFLQASKCLVKVDTAI